MHHHRVHRHRKIRHLQPVMEVQITITINTAIMEGVAVEMQLHPVWADSPLGPLLAI
jgi:hypothetical protein